MGGLPRDLKNGTKTPAQLADELQEVAHLLGTFM